MLQHKCKDTGVNMEDEELVKIFNLILKRRETILFFLIMVINGLTWIVSDIGKIIRYSRSTINVYFLLSHEW